MRVPEAELRVALSALIRSSNRVFKHTGTGEALCGIFESTLAPKLRRKGWRNIPNSYRLAQLAVEMGFRRIQNTNSAWDPVQNRYGVPEHGWEEQLDWGHKRARRVKLFQHVIVNPSTTSVPNVLAPHVHEQERTNG